jgi:hypothetical protein
MAAFGARNLEFGQMQPNRSFGPANNPCGIWIDVCSGLRLCENSVHPSKMAEFAEISFSLIELRQNFRSAMPSA